MVIELQRAGLHLEQQHAVRVFYDDLPFGRPRAEIRRIVSNY